MVRVSERAQGFVEFAIAIPIVLMLLIAIVDLAVVLFEEASFTYGVSQMEWQISYRKATETHNVDELNRVLKGAIMRELAIPEDQIQVSNTLVTPTERSAAVDLGYQNSHDAAGIWSASESRRFLTFTADLRCSIPLPVPFGTWDVVTYDYTLERIVPYESQFEMSWYAPR